MLKIHSEPIYRVNCDWCNKSAFVLGNYEAHKAGFSQITLGIEKTSNYVSAIKIWLCPECLKHASKTMILYLITAPMFSAEVMEWLKREANRDS